MDDHADLAGIRDIPDPLLRARRAHQALPELEQIRNDAMSAANLGGASQAAIAEALGVSAARVSQILKGGPGPERAFWGADKGRLTVAFGQKNEAGKQPGSAGRLLADADAVAFDILKDSVAGLGITAGRELVAPPGFIDLNRPGLVVICGPRLSPMVAQVLAADRSLGFACDAQGWHITDRQTGKLWRSPMNAGEPADIAYLGRLERPDRQGSFLYIAGIHAEGAPGAVHYLAGNLDRVWQRVKTGRFSALIRCTFGVGEDALRITGSELVTEFYEGA